MFQQFDTVLVGRRTFESMARAGRTSMPGMKTVVLSRTLRQADYPKLTVVGEQAEAAVSAIRASAGKDVWLFGGGLLFRSLLAAKLVDTVEVAIVPVLLGGGIPLLPPPSIRAGMTLAKHTVYKTGIVSSITSVKVVRTSTLLVDREKERQSDLLEVDALQSLHFTCFLRGLRQRGRSRANAAACTANAAPDTANATRDTANAPGNAADSGACSAGESDAAARDEAQSSG
jgi:dihydrofolate reductase